MPKNGRDSGVGKTGLGWRLAHGEFKEHASTHGQQFWVLDRLNASRQDGARCEVVLWDLAGQPDYRLIHALFLDDADLALVLFDPTDSRDPLHGVEFWLKQLNIGQPSRRFESGNSRDACRIVLVAARADRGTATLTREELDAYCHQRGIPPYISTSAKEDEGVEELIVQMQALIPWDEKPATVTTSTFKRIKDHVLALKENREEKQVIVSPQEVRQRFMATDADWRFSDAELMTAIGHLENHGYVQRLRTSKGETRILLAPGLLNNLAASFVLEARRNEKGLGSLEEKRLLTRWENAKIGASVSRFVERIDKFDRIIVVGTPLYRTKYENKDTSTGYVVAAEVDVISNRLLALRHRRRRCCRCCWRTRRHRPCRRYCTAVCTPTSATNKIISPSPST